MATIKDVARDAGVSVGTVSNVINGARVGEEKRILVERSIKKLGYQVNTLARGLKTQKTDYVVVMLPEMTNPFFSMLLAYMEKALSSYGKQIVLCISDGDKEKEARFIELAKRNKIDGIIGITYSNIDEYLTDSMAFVSIDRHFHSDIPFVAADNRMGGRLAAENLYRRGSKNLLCFQTISSLDSEVRKRRKGFEEYCEENRISYSCTEFSEKQVSSIYSSFDSRNLIGDVLRAYMNNRLGGSSVDGIFASSDHLAIVICEELRKMGRRVPEDVQVIGFDGLRLLNQAQPLISSIEQPVQMIAESSVANLIRLLNRETVENITNLPVRFVEGGTTRQLPGERADNGMGDEGEA